LLFEESKKERRNWMFCLKSYVEIDTSLKLPNRIYTGD
jgi:hypothetical protein